MGNRSRLLGVCALLTALMGTAFCVLYLGGWRGWGHESPATVEQAIGVGGDAPGDQEKPEGEGLRQAFSLGDPQKSAHSTSESRTLTVASSLGLPLPEVFVASPNSDEEYRIELASDGSTLLSIPVGATIRAAGHSATLVDETSPVVVLEPVLGVQFTASSLKNKTRAVVVIWNKSDQPFVLGDALIADYVGMDRYAIAVDPERYRRVGPGPLEYEIIAKNDLRALGELNLLARGTFTNSVPLTDSDLATCSIEFQCEPGCQAEKNVELWTTYSREERRSKFTVYPWGTQRFDKEGLRIKKTTLGTEVSFEQLIAGREYGASVHCDEHARYGRVSFFARTGQLQRVLLLHGFRIRGQVIAARSALIKIKCRGKSVGQERRFYWYDELSLSLDKDGYFRFAWPASVPIGQKAAWPIPPILGLELKMPLCDSKIIEIELQFSPEVDLGRLEFSESDDVIILARGHGFSSEGPRYARFLSTDGITREVYVKSLRSADDGSLVLRMAEDLGARNGGLPRSIVFSDFRTDHCFERSGDRYVVIPEDEIDVELEIHSWPQDVRLVNFGWIWRGIAEPVNSFRPVDLDEGAWRERISIPHDVDFLWWGDDRFGPEESTSFELVPANVGLAKIIID